MFQGGYVFLFRARRRRDDPCRRCALSTCNKEARAALAGKKKTEQAAYIGGELAKLAMEAGVKQVVLDRGPYKYHGRVKAFADAAREGGLEF